MLLCSAKPKINFMLLKLNPYRIAINPSILYSSAQDLLSKSDKIENLQAFLGWDPLPEILVKGFAPMKDSKKLLSYLKSHSARQTLKTKRKARGYSDFITPRKGLKGWLQKTFADGKELSLTPAHDALFWIHSAPRYLLLQSLHDALISSISTSEPRRVDIEESSSYPNPIVSAFYSNDTAAIEKIYQGLSSPLHKLTPEILVDYFPSHVLYFDRKKSTALYLG
jgi:hypothetical protein